MHPVKSNHAQKSGWRWTAVTLVIGITAVFLGYLSVWIPGPAAGLQFIGVEVGEWLKFLGVGPIRNVFYLPPITLSSIMLLLTVGWGNGRWQTWLWRLIACALALLSFPALEDIRGGSNGEYVPRIWLIGAVFLLFGVITLWEWREREGRFRSLAYLFCAIIGIIGLAYPTWLYSEVRPAISLVMGQAVGVGFGVWLNGLGHLALVIVAVNLMRTTRPLRTWTNSSA